MQDDRSQSQVLDLIRRHILDTGYPPTRADIAPSSSTNCSIGL
jgi:hypothetical protein